MSLRAFGDDSDANERKARLINIFCIFLVLRSHHNL